MWIRIRAVIIEDEPLAAQYLALLLDNTCQVEVVGSATESEAGLRLCAELRPALPSAAARPSWNRNHGFAHGRRSSGGSVEYKTLKGRQRLGKRVGLAKTEEVRDWIPSR